MTDPATFLEEVRSALANDPRIYDVEVEWVVLTESLKRAQISAEIQGRVRVTWLAKPTNRMLSASDVAEQFAAEFKRRAGLE